MARENSYWTEYRRSVRVDGTVMERGPYWYGRVDGRRTYFGLRDPRPGADQGDDFVPAPGDVGQAAIYLDVGVWMGHRTVLGKVNGLLAALPRRGRRAAAVRDRIRAAYECVCGWQGWTPFTVTDTVD